MLKSENKEKPVFLRFNDAMKTVINRDYHIHTTYTDGKSTVEEYILAAIKKGLKEIAFTEHVRQSSAWYNSFVKEVEILRKKYTSRLTIFYGIEAKAIDYDGNIDATEDMIQKSEIVLGSVHRYPSKDGSFLDFRDLSIEDAVATEFELACAVIKNPDVDVLAHPGGVFERHFKTPFPKAYLEKIIKLANKYNKVIEINASYSENISNLLDLCSELNPLVSFGSDAHDTAELGNVIKLINMYKCGWGKQ